MWSETFTDSYGWRWTLRKRSDWSTVQLLASPPEGKGDAARVEPFSYGFNPSDLVGLAGIVQAAYRNLNDPEVRRRELAADYRRRADSLYAHGAELRQEGDTRAAEDAEIAAAAYITAAEELGLEPGALDARESADELQAGRDPRD